MLPSVLNPIIKRLDRSPILVRVAPFAVFLGLTFGQGEFGEVSRYWFYLGKTLVGGWMLWFLRPFIAEMKWALSWEAVAVGVAIFIIWVGLDGLYPSIHEMTQYLHLLDWLRFKNWPAQDDVAKNLWNPQAQFGLNSWVAWVFIGVRIVGSSFVVPPLEEVFYRSFLYRYLAKADFQSVPLGQFNWGPFVMTAAIFGLSHQEWLAGIICGFAYQGLVCWKKRLGDAMTAHAITNFLLGLWVVWKGAWHFW